MVAFYEAVRQPEDGDQNFHDKQACRAIQKAHSMYLASSRRFAFVVGSIMRKHSSAPSVLTNSWGSIIICTRPKTG